jgi:hypothetical protein
MNLRAFLPLLALAGCNDSSPAAVPAAPLPPDPPAAAGACAPGAPLLQFSGSVSSADAKSYHLQPFTVAPGTGRIEVRYGWTEKGQSAALPGIGGFLATTLDLGLWDQNGYRSNAGFRGWSGSRQGRIDREQPPVFVEAGAAERGYVPGPIEPGTWFVDLGIAAVSREGADWMIEVACKSAGGSAPVPDPVDRDHIARAEAGWYHGDFHMHAFHSNPNAPDWEDFIAQARAGGLDFLMVTEYVTGEHWRTLGAVQRAHPDLVIWPGREVITYFGHVSGHGETPNILEYRHGFEDVSIGNIQQAMKADGALFQVNHPTSFPGPVFENFCRGCEFTLGDEIDWGQVDTIEILNGPAIATAGDIGLPFPFGQAENPFMTTAILLWEQQLAAGHKITGVSGSDSKGVDAEGERARKGYGSSATVVYAENLSRAALTAGIQAGHAYVKTRGRAGSPDLMFEATGPNGQRGIFGDTLTLGQSEAATLTTTVSGGMGQLLTYFQNGAPVLTVPVISDPFTHSLPRATRNPLTEGPLGTVWRVETRDAESRTTMGNPIFLKTP